MNSHTLASYGRIPQPQPAHMCASIYPKARRESFECSSVLISDHSKYSDYPDHSDSKSDVFSCSMHSNLCFLHASKTNSPEKLATRVHAMRSSDVAKYACLRALPGTRYSPATASAQALKLAIIACEEVIIFEVMNFDMDIDLVRPLLPDICAAVGWQPADAAKADHLTGTAAFRYSDVSVIYHRTVLAAALVRSGHSRSLCLISIPSPRSSLTPANIQRWTS